jgi:hypothetical protein
MAENYMLRFYPVRASNSRTGVQAGPTRHFVSLNDVEDFMEGLSPDAAAIAWLTFPDGSEAKYIDAKLRGPT